MSLIRAIFWVALFLASTFCFIVIFENGFSNFGDNSKKEWASLQKIFGISDLLSKKKK